MLLIWDINLNKQWRQTNEELMLQRIDVKSPDVILADESTIIVKNAEQKLDVLEKRIFNAEMLLSAFAWINLMEILFYLFNNYQNLKDRWRQFRGIKTKPFLAVESRD